MLVVFFRSGFLRKRISSRVKPRGKNVVYIYRVLRDFFSCGGVMRKMRWLVVFFGFCGKCCGRCGVLWLVLKRSGEGRLGIFSGIFFPPEGEIFGVMSARFFIRHNRERTI